MTQLNGQANVHAADLPPGYRLTELGPLPEEWQVVRLGEAVKFTRKPPGLKIASFQRILFIPMELIPDDGTERPQFIFKQGREISSGTYCETGDILLAKITPSFENGKQCIVPDIKERFAYATTEVYPLKAKPELIDKNYLFALLRHTVVRRNLAAKMEGSTGRQRLPKRVLENFSIPLPPLPEQRAIAYVLRTVQRAKEATERVIAALKELKKSLMKHLFTYGPVPLDQAAQVPLKETEIGPVPEHWEVARLGEVAEIRPYRLTQKQREHKGMIPFIPMLLIPEEGGAIGYELRQRNEIRSGVAILEGDLLLAKITPCLENGKQAIVEGLPGGWGYATTEVFPIRTTEKLTTNLLHHYLLQPTVSNLLASKMEGTTGRKRLPKSVISSLSIPLPPLSEQREISRILQAVDRKIEAEERRKAALQALLKTMLHQLMTGQVRVNVRCEK
jgi:type I restriction enzyme S subunit